MMKKLFFVLAFLSFGFLADAQVSKSYLRADSVILQKSGGNSELIIQNGTRSVTDGVLANKGNGTTEFRALNKFNTLGEGSTELFRLPSAGLATNTVSNVKTGGATSATYSTVGPYDQIAIGGDASNLIEFNGKQSLMSVEDIHLRVKIDSVGTAPIIGLSSRHVGGDGIYSNFGQISGKWTVNLLTGAVTSTPSTSASYTLAAKNDFTNAVAAGEILDVYLSKAQGGYIRFRVVRNGIVPQVTTVYTTAIRWASDAPNNQVYEGIVLAGGKYTILDYKITCPYADPLVLTVGDSMGAGANTEYDSLFVPKLNKAITYKAVSACAASAMLAGMMASINDIIKMRPKYVLIWHMLDGPYYQYVDSTSPNFPHFDSTFKKYINVIKSVGAKPIFIKFTDNAIIPASSFNKWNTWVDKAFPGELVLDLRGKTYTYDSTGFHPSGAMYRMMVDEFVKLLKSLGEPL